MSMGNVVARFGVSVEEATAAIKHVVDVIGAPHHPGLTEGPAPLCREADPKWVAPSAPLRFADKQHPVACLLCKELMHA